MKQLRFALAAAWGLVLILGIISYTPSEAPSWLSYFLMEVCLMVDNFMDGLGED